MTCELRTFYDNFNYIQSRRQLALYMYEQGKPEEDDIF